jgi:predicted dehydrogenase
MATTQHTVLLVGLGAVAQTHIRVLEQMPMAEVVAGVDTSSRARLTFRGGEVPVYARIRDARDHHDPGIVVIATPTPTHAAVCAEVADSFPAARILVEKPAADSLADALHVLGDIGKRQPVDVAYHMAFAPEVTWGMQITQAHADELGAPIGVEASFTDPYYDEFESARTSLGDSWIDSGINSLSVLNRFAEPVARRSFRRIGELPRSVFEAHVACRAGGSEFEALILTSWHVIDMAKTTRIRYHSGAELLMDHTAVAGYLVQDGQVATVFGSDRSVPRRERHYRALYQEWLAEGHRLLPVESSLLLHRLLLKPDDESAQR